MSPFMSDRRSQFERAIDYVFRTHGLTTPGARRRAAAGWASRTLASLMDACREVDEVTADDEPETFAEAVAGELAAFELVEHAKAVADARQIDALARMHAAFTVELDARHAQEWSDRTPLSVHEAVVMEVSTATGLSETEVGLRLDLAIAPASRGRFLREHVANGETTLARATQVLYETRHLDDELADQVARAVLAPTRDGAGLANQLFRQRLRRALLAADADHALRRRRARDRIGADAQLHDDGTGTLTIVNDAEKIVAAIERAEAAARAARAAGDSRSLSELRADFLTGAAIFAGAPGVPAPQGDRYPSHRETGSSAFWRRPAATVWIVVPFSTAAGLDDRPCELPGHGWVSAAHAREIITAEGSIWQTLFVDEPTGQAIRLSHPGYRPTAEIIRHVRAVDGECRAPGCTVPARRCDLDHDVPAPLGETSTDNLSAKHRRHHRIRTTGLWTTIRDVDTGVITWTTAAGRRYTTHPKDWLEHHRPPSDRPRDRQTAAPARDKNGAAPARRNNGAAPARDNNTAARARPPADESPPF